MDYRIQQRRGSSNIIEKKIVTEGKEKWIPYIAPLCRKEEGDVVAELILKYFNPPIQK